ncbi:hypothetical protein WJX75_001395 [Coccomyxa subellipsoidea]|uniref:Uncharacterized protein n=1 Tax=Coccomyxa subellipsoidea TaxID=248742 RepID=A0ABR2YWA1_9CHLO
MRLRESLLRGDNLDLDTTNCDLLSPSLLNCDESVDAKEDWPFPELPSPPKASSCARAVREANQAAACEALAKAFEDLTPPHASRQQATAPAPEEEAMQSVDLDLASPVVLRPPTGGGRRSARTMDPRRVSLAIAQNFDAAASEGGLLGEDEFLELTAPRPQPSAAALKAAALRASNSAFAGEGMIRARRPEQLTVVVQGDGDDLDVGPVMAESPVGHRPPRRAPNEAALRPPPAQQSVVMRDSMALFLQLEGAVKGENGFAADDVLRLNRGGRPPMPSIAEDTAQSDAAGDEVEQSPLPKMPHSATEAEAAQPQGRAEGMRDSMVFFLQLEGAVEGKNGFKPNDVLRLNDAAISTPTRSADRPTQQPASGIPHAPLSKLRRPTLAPTGRPSAHSSPYDRAAAAATHNVTAPGNTHADILRSAEKPAQPALSSLLSAARSVAAGQNRLGPRELPGLGRPGCPPGHAPGSAANAAPAGFRAPAGRTGLRRPTLEPPAEKSSSPVFSRRLAPRVFTTSRSAAPPQQAEVGGALGPLAAGRLQSHAPPAQPRTSQISAMRTRLQSGTAERVLQPKQAPQSRLPRPPTSVHRTPTPTKGSRDFQRMLEEAMNRDDAAAFAGKGGLKNSPLDAKPEPARKARPTAEQRHFQEYRDS